MAQVDRIAIGEVEVRPERSVSTHSGVSSTPQTGNMLGHTFRGVMSFREDFLISFDSETPRDQRADFPDRR